MGDNHRGACRRRWLKLAGIEDGTGPGVTAAKSDELRDCASATSCGARLAGDGHALWLLTGNAALVGKQAGSRWSS